MEMSPQRNLAEPTQVGKLGARSLSVYSCGLSVTAPQLEHATTRLAVLTIIDSPINILIVMLFVVIVTRMRTAL